MSQAPLPTRIDMSDAPVELDGPTLDSLFPADPVPTVAQPPAPDASPAPSAVPTTTAPAEPFVKGNRSVYKTREAAVEGIDQKDALIEQMRQQYSLVTGVDPITKQPIGSQAANASESYIGNAKRYVADLKAATTEEQLASVQQKLILDTLQPMAPAISGVTRAAASRQVEAEIPDFNTFYNSEAYQEVLSKVPTVREAIEMAESDIRFHARLPELYKTAYLVSRGIQLPELLKRNSASAQPAGRPTASGTTATPIPDNTPSGGRTVRTGEGRKSIIADFESKHGNTTLPW